MENIFRNEKTAMAMAQFCKRSTFEIAYYHADGDTDAAREAMAYQIIDGINDVREYLRKLGFAPR